MTETKHFGALAAAAGLLVAVALLVLMLVVNPQTAGAAFPGTNGRIAYSAWDGTDLEIFTIPATGGQRVQVTDNTVPDTEPSYSPDGNRIAYSGTGGICAPSNCDDYEIFTIPDTGGQRVQITQNVINDDDPSYSPDGNRIAYSSGRGIFGGGTSAIFTQPASGNPSAFRTQITFGPGNEEDPSYSPDGNTIAYQSNDGTDSEIFTIPATGGRSPVQVTNNTRNDVWPDYRPGSNAIVYSAYDGNDLEISSVACLCIPVFGIQIWQNPVQLTNNTTGEFHPVYSPDAQQIAFSAYNGNDQEIFRMPATTGGTRTRVTFNTNINDVEPSWQPR
jgi:TolB protein